MKSLKGSKTAENLIKAFAGESQARNRYTFYASKAKKEGLMQIHDNFLETAAQEKEHAEIFFKFLAEDVNGEALRVDANYPVSLYSKTSDNLVAAKEGEWEEYDVIYPEFARIAEEEGFPKVAFAFRKIAEIEKHHHDRYQHFFDLLSSGKIFKKEQKIRWICQNCGHIHEGTDAPRVCPVCDHPQGYFHELKDL